VTLNNPAAAWTALANGNSMDRERFTRSLQQLRPGRAGVAQRLTDLYFDEWDVNHDGSINRREFIAAVEAFRSLLSSPPTFCSNPRLIFAYYVRDGNTIARSLVSRLIDRALISDENDDETNSLFIGMGDQIAGVQSGSGNGELNLAEFQALQRELWTTICPGPIPA
jgi:hypothetical protein